MDANQLQELKTHLKELIAKGKTGEAIAAFREVVPSHSEKYNVLVHLSEQFNTLEITQIKNTQNFDLLQIRKSSLTSNLLTLIDILTEADFVQVGDHSSKTKNKIGSVLYAIPSKMELGKERMCTVRLAFDQAYLLANFLDGEDTHIRSLRRMDKKMEVQLVDPNADQAFGIRTISSAVQIVEDDDYTEWIFFVNPGKEGTFRLFLKISIIISEDGEKIRKELILQEEIEVVTEIQQEEQVGLELKHSGFVFALGLPAGMGGWDDAGGEVAEAAGEVSRQLAAEAGKTSLAGGIAKLVTSKIGALVGSAAIISAGAFGLWQMNTDSSAEADLSGLNDPVETYIQPPFDAMQVETISLWVEDPSRPTVFELRSGTEISIPANTFVDAGGAVVQERVEIRFREFHRPAEVMASGIPMHVNHQKVDEDWMETAGMFELRGFSQNRPVLVDRGKSIDVQQQSQVAGKYDIWAFNETDGNWTNTGPGDTPVREKITNDSLEQQVEALRKSTRTPPPNPDDPKNMRLVLTDLDLKSTPELEGKDPIVVLYAGKDPAEAPMQNQWILDADIWIRKELKPTKQSGVYQMTFYGDSLYSIPVRLALQGGDRERAKVRYQQLLREYEEKLSLLREKEALLDQQYAFRRMIGVNRFGIYNHDVLWKVEDAVRVKADFKFNKPVDAIKELITIYLITNDDRTVISFPARDWNKFQFSPGSDNKLVAVLPNDEVAIFTQSDFREEESNMRSANGGDYVFNMQTEQRRINSLDSLEDLIRKASQ